jgi:death on curing protein
VKYVSAQDILVLHAKVVEQTGGRQGIRDVHLLVSLAERPKASFDGKEMFPSVFEKAGTYLESLTTYHVFIDGNKRTAIITSARFLLLNGYKLAATNREIEDFVVRVASEKVELRQIARWFKAHSKKL